MAALATVVLWWTLASCAHQDKACPTSVDGPSTTVETVDMQAGDTVTSGADSTLSVVGTQPSAVDSLGSVAASVPVVVDTRLSIADSMPSADNTRPSFINTRPLGTDSLPTVSPRQEPWYSRQLEEVPGAAFILISKQDMRLQVYDYDGLLLADYPMACGKNYGNKQRRGDMRTPEGVFSVSQIQNASWWQHDFGDGNGPVSGAYGPWFIRLETPGHRGIGIHGTHLPSSIGTRATEGCIRLHNDDVQALRSMVYVGMKVIITPSDMDLVTR